MNQYNFIHDNKPPEPPRQFNSQPPLDHFNSCNFSPKYSTVVSDIMGRQNNHNVYNGDVEVYD